MIRRLARTLFMALPLALALVHATPVAAVQPDEMLDDPVLEARAREISKEVRCLVCQNESIDSSNAGLARDLRILIRERLVAGDSNQQVKDFLVARYGAFVLLEPPLDLRTYLLWFGPGVVLAAGALGIFLYFRRRRAADAPAPLSPEEQARLRELLETDDGARAEGS